MEQANSPATKHDVEQVRSEVKLVSAEIKQVRGEMKQDVEQLRSEMNHQYRDLVERFTARETKLLKVLQSWTS